MWKIKTYLNSKRDFGQSRMNNFLAFPQICKGQELNDFKDRKHHLGNQSGTQWHQV